MRILFVFVFLSGIAFGQSKKKQIESLNKRLDSINYVLEIERRLYKEQIDKANQNLKEENKKFTDKVSELNTNILKSKISFQNEINILKNKILDSLAKKNINELKYFTEIEGDYFSYQISDHLSDDSPEAGFSIYKEGDMFMFESFIALYGDVILAEICSITKYENSYNLILRGFFENGSVEMPENFEKSDWRRPDVKLKIAKVTIDYSNNKKVKFTNSKGVNSDNYIYHKYD